MAEPQQLQAFIGGIAFLEGAPMAEISGRIRTAGKSTVAAGDAAAGCRLLASIFHLLASTCWLPSPAYWLLPVGFHIYLACLFSLSPAGCLSPAGIRLPPADLRLLASCSRLLAVACWVPPPAGSLSHAGCRLLAASIFHLLGFTFCFLFLAAPLRVHPHMTLAAESWRPWLIDPQRGLWSLSGARAVHWA